jgi:hypothetical protein
MWELTEYAWRISCHRPGGAAESDHRSWSVSPRGSHERDVQAGGSRRRGVVAMCSAYALLLTFSGAPAQAHELSSAPYGWWSYNGYTACGRSTVHVDSSMGSRVYSTVADNAGCAWWVSANVGGSATLRGSWDGGSTWSTCQSSNPPNSTTGILVIYVWNNSCPGATKFVNCGHFEAWISGAYSDTYSAYPLCSPIHG